MSKDKQVVLLRGPSGSGKSTYVKKNFPDAVVCSADNFHIDSKGNYNWKPQNVAKAHGWCKSEFKKALKEGRPLVVVDNTNTQRWEMEPYVKMARKAGYKLRVVRLKTPTDVAAMRNVHNVPAASVKKMAARMEDVPEDWDETVVSGV